jgi:hypothetical protein
MFWEMRDVQMLKTTLIVSIVAVAAISTSASACDGKADIEAAFNEQHKAPWRTESKSKSDTGVEQTQQFDFVPPDRIYRKVTAGEEKAETVAIGTTAWSNEGAGWQELKKGIADIISSQLKSTLAPAKVSVDFKCLDKVEFAGKSYIGYQTEPEMVRGQSLSRTILIDPETKRPAFNIIGAPDLSGEPMVTETYSYPADISIEKPL